MKKQLLVGAMLMGAFFTANAQDSCDDALVLSLGTTNIEAMEGDYYAEGDGGCFLAPTDPAEPEATAAAWYTFTADSDAILRLNTNLESNDGTLQSDDTRFAVYTGSCEALECYVAADDVSTTAPVNYLTDLLFIVEAGETYWIAFDNKWSALGFDVEFSVYSTPDCPTTAPFTEDWTNLANFYLCWTSTDADEDGTTWDYSAQYDFDGDGEANPVAWAWPGGEAGDGAKDDYLVSPAVNLAAGSEYTFSIIYNAVNLQDAGGNTIEANESFEVVVLGADDFMQEIGSEEGIAMSGETLGDLVENATEGTYTFTPATAGSYSFAIHATSPADTGVLMIFEASLDGLAGTDDVLASKFSVFPNPANDVINIANAENMLVNGVTITDINGRTVKSAQFAGVTNATVNVSDLASGVYMMTVSSDKGTATKKIVKN